MQQPQAAGESTVLEETIDENYEPTEEEIRSWTERSVTPNPALSPAPNTGRRLSEDQYASPVFAPPLRLTSRGRFSLQQSGSRDSELARARDCAVPCAYAGPRPSVMCM